MKVRELLAMAQVPGGEELRLYRRDGDFMIVLDRNELMNSRMSGSEEALATLTWERLKNRRNPRLPRREAKRAAGRALSPIQQSYTRKHQCSSDW